MSLNATPSANRLHIGFFGLRNAGKSSVVNAVTGQDLAVVSPVKGTTTDPVQKAMELLPLGPVVVIDTPGFDDAGELGDLRVAKTRRILSRVDIAVLVVDGLIGLQPADRELLRLIDEKKIPCLVVYNKSDLANFCPVVGPEAICVSAATGDGIAALKDRIGALRPQENPVPLVRDLLAPGDTVVLVMPIDASAPKGRLILPQQQMLRDVLEAGALAVGCRETELSAALAALKAPPAMVITDSQAFNLVAKITPESVPLTSFSILMARYKGFLETAVRGAAALGRLQDGDTVLIAEGCTHHRQCNDIGTVKLPRWLRERTGKDIHIETSSGGGFPEDLSRFALVIHCGGCMLSPREVQFRRAVAADQGVPFTNYGVAIAYTQGILRRSLSVFPELAALLDD
jgi:[FeFe] hydrogenase H-cluster maturation GTPase HydF